MLNSYKKSKEKELPAGQPRQIQSTSPDKLPRLTDPTVRRVWVPDQIDGNKYIRGHEVLIIDDSSNWLKSSGEQ